jgi:hypothetical protein
MAPMRAFDIKGRGLKGIGDRDHFCGLDEQKDGSRINEAPDQQGQAMRSTFGRSRVTQTVCPSAFRSGSFASTTSGKIGALPRFEGAFDAANRAAEGLNAFPSK